MKHSGCLKGKCRSEWTETEKEKGHKYEERNRETITRGIKVRRKDARRKGYKHSVNEEGLERRTKMKEDMREIII